MRFSKPNTGTMLGGLALAKNATARHSPTGS